MKTDRPWEKPDDDYDDAVYAFLKASTDTNRLFVVDLILQARDKSTRAWEQIRADLAAKAKGRAA